MLERLAERVPVLRGRVAAYLAAPEGTPSAHGFVAHVAREIVEVPGVWPAGDVRQVLDFFESEWGVDERVDALIELSSVEVLVDHKADVRELLGPKLGVEFERQTLGYVIGRAEDLFLGRLLGALLFLRAAWDRDHEFYEEHKAEGFFRPPSPGTFMIEIAVDAVHRYRAGGVEEAEQLRALFAFMESEVGDPATERLVDEFVEMLPEPGRGDDDVLDMLGPRLRSLRDEQVRREDESASEAEARFLYRMADEVPYLRDRLREHFGRFRRPLGHVFVGEIVFEVFELYAAGEVERVRPLLDFLEREFGYDDEVDNVIAVSFVEMLPDPGETGFGIEAVLGPKLRGEVASQRAWGEERMRELAAVRKVPPADGIASR
ncbi:hypothetical protein E0H73_25455 [Kribbella pittospori]|uniref:DUF7674 domain-containing protein n=1 Tax=Kribbella pittospori TaxID=722689 RepID=A0A4R0KKU7_9ACTN|nr:hypothetical protein [Kribbella pittospori]TCC58668.1 hypothetical protein E0H73_25455 [Kribbella pittospori]